MKPVTTSTLNDVMEFDHVIESHGNGFVSEPKGYFAPELIEGELHNDDWTLLSGFSRQDGYSGPIMHRSEYLGGGMAAYIIDNPGIYVVVEDIDPSDMDEIDGWAVAVLNK